MNDKQESAGTLSVDVNLRGAFLRPKQMADLLGVSDRSLIVLWQSGRIPAPIRIARTPLWLRAAVHEWIEEGCPVRPVDPEQVEE